MLGRKALAVESPCIGDQHIFMPGQDKVGPERVIERLRHAVLPSGQGSDETDAIR